MNAKLRHYLFIALTLFAGLASARAQLTNLAILPAGNQTVLVWPATFANCTVQYTTNLATANWLTASNSVPLMAVAIPNTSPTMFFRLSSNASTPSGMALIPADSFTMGDTLDGEMDATPANVMVSAFYMDTQLVSYSQWQPVFRWAVSNGYTFDNAGSGKAANHPVQTVNWYDVVKWSNARSQQAYLTPVYYTNAELTEVYTNGDTDAVYVNWAASGYRLPTEAEWEKAARGGLSGQRYPMGFTISESQANYYGDTLDSFDLGPNGFNAVFEAGAEPYTSPVGYFAGNGYGLFDMAGNVNEWCWDWYGTPYGQPTATNPTGPASGSFRVLRGGNWLFVGYFARCAYRDDSSPVNADNNVGFRCVKGL